MPAAGQLRNGSPPTSPTPPNNLAPHDSLFLGSAGRWPVAFGSLPNALIAAHNSVQNTSQGFAASCRELQASGLRSPERRQRCSEKKSLMSDSGCPTDGGKLLGSL